MKKQEFGAGIWHFATYLDRYAKGGKREPRCVIETIKLVRKVKYFAYVDINYPYFGVEFSNEQIKKALDKAGLKVIGITPEIYTREFSKGAFTNPDPGVRKRAHELITEACEAVRFFNASYVKLWPGQDGWDYPFQVDHKSIWKNSMDGVGSLATENSDLKFVIEYKPREPRVKMIYDSMTRTLLGIEQIGLPNIGVLLDFGHAIYGGESAADSAQLAIDHGRLFGMDVNDNYRSWDDDLLAWSPHAMELYEIFSVLRINNWQGVWQLDQFPFREDSVEMANMAIDFLKSVDKALDDLDYDALSKAQANHDAMGALKIAQKALYKHLARD